MSFSIINICNLTIIMNNIILLSVCFLRVTYLQKRVTRGIKENNNYFIKILKFEKKSYLNKTQ